MLPNPSNGDPSADAALAAQNPAEQWLPATPRLRQELNIDLRQETDRLVAIIEDPVRSRFFQIGLIEYHFLMMFDGRRTIADIIGVMQRDRGFENFDESSAIKICNWLSSLNLIDLPGAGTTDRLCQAAQAKGKQERIGMLNPVSIKINLVNPDQTLEKILPYCRWIFSPAMLVIWVLTGMVAGLMVQTDYQRFSDAATGILATDRWLWLLIVWVGLKIVHEMAHGLACKKFGGDVPQAGMLILLFAPMAFVNVTSSWRFSSRKKRMIVSVAGMYVELFIAFLAMIVWYFTRSQIVSDICYNVVVMAGLSTLLFNANPLLRFDGYYLLSDGLGIVNLYGKGQNWFNDRVRHLIFGFPLDRTVCPPDELRYVAFYGVCSFAWRILLSVSLMLLASTLLGGAGLILALIGGVFWVWLPISQNVRKIRAVAAETPIQKRRIAAVSLLAATLLVLCFYVVKAPEVTTAPAIVQFENEKIIRAAADGFVDQVLVSNGQVVKQGQVLMTIENPELVGELKALRLSAESARIQARIHQQKSEISLQQASLAKAKSVDKQIVEMTDQVADLKIRAPFDGVVFQRGLNNMVGQFVEQGDVLMHFVDPGQKQILTSIDQEQIRAVRTRMDRPVRFMFAGVKTINATFDSIDPRASDVPVDASLTAASGGSLPVRPKTESETEQANDDGYRLMQPRFTGRSDLDRQLSDNLMAGQRGTALLAGRNVSVGGFVILQARDWIRAKLDAATQSQQQ